MITFDRSNWRPYCNLVLNTYQRILPEIKALTTNLIAIFPQTPASNLDTKAKHDFSFKVVSDTENSNAKQFTTTIKNSNEAVDEAKKLSVDFYNFYNVDPKYIPIPNLSVIDTNGSIVFEKSEGRDYSLRVGPQDILDALGHVAK